MYDNIAVADQLLQCRGVVQVALNQRYTLCCQMAGLARIAHQGADLKAFTQ